MAYNPFPRLVQISAPKSQRISQAPKFLEQDLLLPKTFSLGFLGEGSDTRRLPPSDSFKNVFFSHKMLSKLLKGTAINS